MLRTETVYEWYQEAAAELLSPVLHRMDVPELSAEQRSELSALQTKQAGYTLQAQRNFCGVDREDYFFSKSCSELGDMWSRFALAVAPPAFLVSTKKRRALLSSLCPEKRSEEQEIFNFLMTHLGDNTADQAVTHVREEHRMLLDRKLLGIAALEPRENVPFGVHYAVTAGGINRLLYTGESFVRPLLRPADYVKLRASVGKKSLADSIREVRGLKVVGLPDKSDLEEKLPPEAFPYQQHFFDAREGVLPPGVSTLDEFTQWYSDKINALVQLVRGYKAS